MISMSRLRLVVLSSLALCFGLAGCDNKVCSLIGCSEGLLITFDGSFGSNKTYDITVSDVTTDEVVPILGCTLVAGDGTNGTLRCSSVHPHSEQGSTVSLRDPQPSRLDIKVSVDGVQIADKQFDVAFKTVELNGPGCGTCTNASVTMSLL